MDFICTMVLLSSAVLTTTIAQGPDIRVPPKITEGPNKVILYRDKVKVSLTCQGVGSPQPTYTWLKDGAPITQTGSVDIPEATVDNEGYYQCLATNPNGKAMTNVTLLKVATLGTYNANAPKVNYTARANDKLRVICGPPDSKPAAQFDWSYNTTDLIQTDVVLSRRVQVDFNGDLCFASVSSAETANQLFRCNVDNYVLSAAQSGAYSWIGVSGPAVNNIAPSLFFSSPSTVIALQSQQTKLRAFFSGTDNNGQGLITYTWTYNGRNVLPPGWTVMYGEARSPATGTDPSAAGIYVCTGTNSIGSATATMELVVEAIPNFGPPENQPRDMNATEGNTITMRCQPNAVPRADIQWFKNTVAFNRNSLPPKFSLSSDLTTLTISDLCKKCSDGTSDLMNIQCNASNIHGYSFAQGYVNVLLTTTVTSESVSVQWSPNAVYQFPCAATCDDSTPCTTEWTFGDQPVEVVDGRLTVDDQGTLIINTADDADQGSSRVGTYTCNVSNGYSSTAVDATIEQVLEKTTASLWWIAVLVLGIIFLILLIVLLYYFCFGPGKEYCTKKECCGGAWKAFCDAYCGCSCCRTNDDITDGGRLDQFTQTVSETKIQNGASSSQYVFLPTYRAPALRQQSATSTLSLLSTATALDTLHLEGQGNLQYMVPVLPQQHASTQDVICTIGAQVTDNNLFAVVAQQAAQETGLMSVQNNVDGVQHGQRPIRNISQGGVSQGDVILREIFQGNAFQGEFVQNDSFHGGVYMDGAFRNEAFQEDDFHGDAFHGGVVHREVFHGGDIQGGGYQRVIFQGRASQGGVIHGGIFQGGNAQRRVTAHGGAYQGRAFQEDNQGRVSNANRQETWCQYGDRPQTEV